MQSLVQIMACCLYATSHYLNQCWILVNWNPGNKFQGNLIQSKAIFIQEIAFENVDCKLAAISTWAQIIHENVFENVVCWNGGHFVQGKRRGVNSLWPSDTIYITGLGQLRFIWFSNWLTFEKKSSRILIKLQKLSFKKMYLHLSRP